MPHRHKPTRRVIPEPLTPGRVRCICGRAVRVNSGGRIRRHNTPAGEPCAHIAGYGTAEFDVLPPVQMPPKRSPQQPKSAPRLDVGSTCRECGKWLPGERSLCGRCYVRAEAERRRPQSSLPSSLPPSPGAVTPHEGGDSTTTERTDR